MNYRSGCADRTARKEAARTRNRQKITGRNRQDAWAYAELLSILEVKIFEPRT